MLAAWGFAFLLGLWGCLLVGDAWANWKDKGIEARLSLLCGFAVWGAAGGVLVWLPAF